MRQRRPLRFVIVALAFLAPQITNVLPAAASDWNLVDSHCFPYTYNDDGTYIHACWQLHKLTQDGSGTKDYFQLSFYATAGIWVNFAELNGIVLQVNPKASPAQAWVDWKPRSDWEGGACSTFNIGISYVATFNLNVDRCPERWDMTHFATPGKQAIFWSHLGGVKADREAGIGVVVKVNQGTRPGWTFIYGSGS